MMLDSFAAAMESGFSIQEYRYVGMGGNRFYDFALIHKYLGIDKMVSLEHDEDMFARAQYNCPYRFIEVENTTVNEFLDIDDYVGNSIYWMDYDGPISTVVVGDIVKAAQSLVLGDFLFVTVCATLPRLFHRMGAKQRLVELQERFGEAGGSLLMTDVEDAAFPEAVYKILGSAFYSAFAFADRGLFCPFFSVEYADGIQMLTYGGVFAAEESCNRFMNKVKNRVPVLYSSDGGRYRIRKLDLTEKERRLFDRAATSVHSSSDEQQEIERLGFQGHDVQSYREMLRYYPRYVETII